MTASLSSSLAKTSGGTASLPGPRRAPAVREWWSRSGGRVLYGPNESEKMRNLGFSIHGIYEFVFWGEA